MDQTGSVHQYPGAQTGIQGPGNMDRYTFVPVYKDVLPVLQGTPSLYVYMAFRNRIHENGGAWFATRQAWADEAKVSVKTFDRCVKNLIELGLLDVRHRFVPRKWKGDPAQIAWSRSDDCPIQIGSLYTLFFNLPLKDDPQGNPVPTPYERKSPPPYEPESLPRGQKGHTDKEPLDKDSREEERVIAPSRTPAESATAPSPSFDPLDAIAVPEAGTPEEWCSADDPRCREHAGLPGWEVPACRACGSVREWFESRVPEKSKPERCPACVDSNGFIDMEDERGQPYVIRCDHRQAA